MYKICLDFFCNRANTVTRNHKQTDRLNNRPVVTGGLAESTAVERKDEKPTTWAKRYGFGSGFLFFLF